MDPELEFRSSSPGHLDVQSLDALERVFKGVLDELVNLGLRCALCILELRGGPPRIKAGRLSTARAEVLLYVLGVLVALLVVEPLKLLLAGRTLAAQEAGFVPVGR